MNETLDLDAINWLNVPDVAKRLDVEISHVRGLLDERALIGIKRGERSIFQVPAAFLIESADGDGVMEVLPTLRGTVTLLADQGFTDAEAIEWLFTHDDALGSTPVDALRAGQRAAVRRLAQTLV